MKRKDRKNLQKQIPSPNSTLNTQNSKFNIQNSTFKTENSTFNTQHSKLPRGWGWVRLGEVIKLVKGKKPKNLGDKSEFLKLPYINIEAFELKKFNQYTDGENCPTCAPEDILIVWDGARCGLVGRGVKGVIGSTLAKLECADINKPFLYYFLQTQYEYINKHPRGVGIPHVEPNLFWNIPLPLPPLAEQRRIVTKIEELFTKLDAGVEALKKAKEQIKRYRQAVLKYAFEGKLTEEWRKSFELSILNDELKQTQNPQLNTQNSTFKTENSTFNTQHSKFTTQNYESASVLLERIKEERKKKLGKKYRELPPVNASELPELPEGWVWVRLGEVSDITPEDDYSNFDPMLPTTFIPMSSIDEVTGTIKNPTILPLKDARKGHTHFKENDVLFARITPCMENGKSAIARNLKNGVGFGSTEFIVIRPTSCILPEIIFYFIRQETYRHRAKMHFKSTVGQLRVPKEFVILSIIPLPPLAEQQQIVEEIERRFSVVDEVEKAIDRSLKEAERLRQSILKRAFEGKVVPQDPNDEPAEKLLERIREEKAKRESEKKVKKKGGR